jgi:hypothetical protein
VPATLTGLKPVCGGPFKRLPRSDGNLDEWFWTQNAAGAVEHQFAEWLIRGDGHGASGRVIDDPDLIVLFVPESLESNPNRLIGRRLTRED